VKQDKTPGLKIAMAGILTALTVILGSVENLIISFIPGLPPGVRLGLSNILIMAAIVLLGEKYAFPLAVMKGLFVLLSRGFTAGIMSLTGTLAAFVTLSLMIRFTKRGYIFISVCAAITHIIIQILTACILTGNIYTLYYLPIPLVTSIITGVLTGIIFSGTIKGLMITKNPNIYNP
jgi:heptaprenyl diphosphate synthase